MKYKYIGFLFSTIFCFFLFNYKSFSQSSDTIANPIEIGLEVQAGSVYKHTKKLDGIPTGTPYAVQLYLTRNTTGNKLWHQQFNYPSYGLILGYFDLGNKKILGDAVVALAYMQIHFLHLKKSTASWSFGSGLSYVTGRYNKDTNPLNLAISQHINYTLQSQFAFNYQLFPQIKVKAFVGLTHMSNGSLKKPNLGINLPMAGLGVFFNPKPGVIVRNKQTVTASKKPLNLHVNYNMSFSRLDTSDKVYPAHLLSIYLSKRVTHLHSFLLGVEGVYDKAVGAEIEQQKSWGIDVSKFRIERALVTVGHELTITRLALTTQFCFYVYKPFKSKSFTYQRFQFKYYLTKNIYASTALRAHFGTADGAELGLGFRL